MPDGSKRERSFYDCVANAGAALASIVADQPTSKLSKTEVRERLYECVNDVVEALQIEDDSVKRRITLITGT